MKTYTLTEREIELYKKFIESLEFIYYTPEQDHTYNPQIYLRFVDESIGGHVVYVGSEHFKIEKDITDYDSW